MVRSRPDVLCQGGVVCHSRQQAAIDMEGTSSFIVELFLVCAFVCLACGQSCPSQDQTSAKSKVCIQRNQPGHSIPQVRIEQGACNNTVTINTCTAGVPPPRPGPGYELHPGVGYYKIHSDPKNWHEARKICAEEGGHLAIINSEEESKVLQSLFAPVAAKLLEESVMIGFHDLYNEGEYLTVFDEPLNSTGFYRWSRPGEPNNASGSETHPGQDCGSMFTNGGLDDHYCYVLLPFICEQELC